MKIHELERDKHILSTETNIYTDSTEDEALREEEMVIHSASHGTPPHDITQLDTELMVDNLAEDCDCL